MPLNPNDATDARLHGRQEGRFFHGYYRDYCYLPLLAYISVQSPEKAEIARGFGAACTLLVLVLVLFFGARMIGGRGAGQLTPRQQRRRALGSRRDLARFERYQIMRPPADQTGYPEEAEA